jgi:hypothetical protein
MKRAQLEHLIRACAQIADDDELIVIRSQAILGQYPEAPPSLLVSVEADIYPKSHPERADLIDGSIGEGSPFHDTFGYYARGVGESTATLPEGWKERLVPVRNGNTRGATGWCLEAHDLVVSKLVAGRDKDLIFAEEAVRHELVNAETLAARLRVTMVSADLRPHLEQRIERLAALR